MPENVRQSAEPLHVTPILTNPSIEPMIKADPGRPAAWRVISVVGFYIVCSIAMVMINKAILNQIPLPLTFLWGQLVVAVLLLKIASWLRLLTLPPVTMEIGRALLPLIGMNVVGLTLNTLCLHRIDAVMYQVTRSLILPITAGLSVWLMGDRLSGAVLASCAVIFAGFLAGVLGEQQAAIRISTVGLILGLLSSLSTALHSIVIKQSFSSLHHNGAFDLVYYNNLFSALLLLPFTLLYEYADLVAWHQAYGSAGWIRLLWAALLAGASGLLINVAGFLQIKVTSPLTHTVSSAARGVLQSLCAHLFLHELLTQARLVGISVTLAGSCAYSYYKSLPPPTKPAYNSVEMREAEGEQRA